MEQQVQVFDKVFVYYAGGEIHKDIKELVEKLRKIQAQKNLLCKLDELEIKEKAELLSRLNMLNRKDFNTDEEYTVAVHNIAKEYNGPIDLLDNVGYLETIRINQDTNTISWTQGSDEIATKIKDIQLVTVKLLGWTDVEKKLALDVKNGALVTYTSFGSKKATLHKLNEKHMLGTPIFTFTLDEEQDIVTN